MMKMGTALLISGLLGTVAGTIIERPGIEQFVECEYSKIPLSLDGRTFDGTTSATIRKYYKSSVSVCWHYDSEKSKIHKQNKDCNIRYIPDPQFSSN